MRWEFIQYVLGTSPLIYDEHFQPVTLLCSSCHFQYNFIIKYENISDEEPLFIRELGASRRRNIERTERSLYCLSIDILQSRWLNSNKLNVTDRELLETYFSLLTDTEIKKLHEIYLLDFQQFNYSFEFRGIKYE